MVPLYRHYGSLDDHRATIEVIYDNKETPLSVIRPCGMDNTSSIDIDICESPYQTIIYLLRNEQGDLEVKSQS